MKFIIVISILITAFKVVMAAILWRYGGNPHGTRRKASFTVLNFNLDANPVRNVITPVITKTFPKFLIR